MPAKCAKVSNAVRSQGKPPRPLPKPAKGGFTLVRQQAKVAKSATVKWNGKAPGKLFRRISKGKVYSDLPVIENWRHLKRDWQFDADDDEPEPLPDSDPRWQGVPMADPANNIDILTPQDRRDLAAQFIAGTSRVSKALQQYDSESPRPVPGHFFPPCVCTGVPDEMETYRDYIEVCARMRKLDMRCAVVEATWPVFRDLLPKSNVPMSEGVVSVPDTDLEDFLLERQRRTDARYGYTELSRRPLTDDEEPSEPMPPFVLLAERHMFDPGEDLPVNPVGSYPPIIDISNRVMKTAFEDYARSCQELRELADISFGYEALYPHFKQTQNKGAMPIGEALALVPVRGFDAATMARHVRMSENRIADEPLRRLFGHSA